jgi:hypothetical protein
MGETTLTHEGQGNCGLDASRGPVPEKVLHRAEALSTDADGAMIPPADHAEFLLAHPSGGPRRNSSAKKSALAADQRIFGWPVPTV